MTGIRAYVRRGLATNPICSRILDGHEAAWLAMRIQQDLGRQTAPSTIHVGGERTDTPPQRPLMERIKKMILARLILARPGSGAEIDQTYTPAVWELPTLQSNMDPEQILAVANAVVRGGRTFRLAEEARLSENERLCAVFFPSQLRPPSSSLETKTPRRTEPLSLETASQSHRPAAMEVGLHDSIQVPMPHHDDTPTIGLRLAMTIEKVATKCAGIEAIQWRTGDNVSPSSIFISIPVAVQTLGSPTMDKAVRLLVRRQASDTDQLGEEMPNSRPWVLEDRNELQSVLALWQYTLAERQSVCSKNPLALVFLAWFMEWKGKCRCPSVTTGPSLAPLFRSFRKLNSATDEGMPADEL